LQPPIAVTLLIALMLAPLPDRAQQAAPVSSRTPVLVELFTSEGCSSCPPADQLLARLDRDQPIQGADIIVLSEHVDYWDSLGWRDRFSSPYLTQRQKYYQTLFNLGDVFTPQVVVNGSAQFVGSDSEGIGKAIERASAPAAVPLTLASVEVHQNEVAFTLRNGPDIPHWVNLYAALVDPSDTTEVRAGENGGRTLHHAGVMRALALMCSECVTARLGARLNRIQAPGTANLNGMRLVVFVNEKHNGPLGPIAGAVSCVLSTGPIPHSAAEAPFPANPCPGSASSLATTRPSPIE
jgi:hypothetical protein